MKIAAALIPTSILALVLALFFVIPASQDATAAPLEKEVFEGKIMTLYVDDPLKGSGQVLRDVELKKIGDRWMVFGLGVSTGQAGEWDEDLIAGVAWDAVTAFYLMTPDEFDTRVRGVEF